MEQEERVRSVPWEIKIRKASPEGNASPVKPSEPLDPVGKLVEALFCLAVPLPLFMLLAQMTRIVFVAALALSLTTLGVLYEMGIWYWPLALVSVLFKLWAIYQSDRSGFVRAREFPRSKEPPRHFNPFQTIILFGLLLAEVSFVVYLVVRRIR